MKGLRRRFSALVVLFQLRFRLYAAQARTVEGRIQILVALLGLTALNAWCAGRGWLAAEGSLRSAQFGGVVLRGFLLNGVAGTLFLGQRMRARFSEAALRRYPLRRQDRFLARNLLGLGDPLWLLIAFLGLGYAIAVTGEGNGSWYAGIAGMALYLSVVYLVSTVLIEAMQWLVATIASTPRRGALLSLLAVVAIGGFSAWVALAGQYSMFSGHPYAPWEVTRAVLFEASAAATGIPVLAAWTVVLAVLLYLIEGREHVTPAGSFGAPSSRRSVFALTDAIAAPFGPLMAQASCYYLRSPRVLPGMVALPLLAGLSGRVLSARHAGGDVDTTLLAAGLFFMCGFLSTANVAMNQLGYAGDGFWRFLTFPARFADVVRAGSLVSSIIGALVTVAALLVKTAAQGMDLATLAILVFSAIAGLAYFGAVAVWTSVLAPKRASLWNIMEPPFSGTAMVALLASTALPLLVTTSSVDRTMPGAAAFPRWLLPGLVGAGIALYALTWRAVAALPARYHERVAMMVGGGISPAKE